MSSRPTQVAIASCTPKATQAGELAVKAGGNAFDAAVAVAFNLMVSHPLMCSIGGGGFATVKRAGEKPVVIDFFNAMAGKGLPTERLGQNLKMVNVAYGPGVDVITGHASISVPGTALGLEHVLKAYGTLPMGEVLAPTIVDARAGVPLNKTIAYWLSVSAKKLHWQTEYCTQLLSTETGEIPELGHLMKNPDLANTLELLAKHGSGIVHGGDIGEQIANTVLEGGGILTLEDLATYQLIQRQPLEAKLGRYHIYTNPPPSVGGCTLIQILKVMNQLGLKTWDPTLYSQLALTCHTALSSRFALFEGGSHPDPEDLYQLVQDEAILEKYKHVTASANTTQLCTADDAGNACSITMSMGYGSGVAIPGTGIFMDNSLGELELNPGGFHKLTPGDRLVSNMTPTIAEDAENNTLLSIGTPGASRIATVIAQVLLQLDNLGQPLDKAVAAPRLHWDEGKLLFETGVTLDMDMIPKDWEIIEFKEYNMYFGGIQAALKQGNTLQAESDPRRAGCASVTALK